MSGFPSEGLVPKQETQAASFLKKYPNYDGRNVTIAILDTGVDPAAPGLLATSEGKPKILDIIDCTGSGDVNTQHIVKAEEVYIDEKLTSRTVTGLTGRTLKLGLTWNCPKGEYHLGMKFAYQLFSKEAQSTLKKERAKSFEISHGELVQQAQHAQQKFSQNQEKNTSNQQMSKELETRMDMLKSLMQHKQDPGPVFDCVVFWDGNHWRAAVDFKESGDLTDQELLTDYKIERKYWKYSDKLPLSISVNVYDNGNLLSLVTDVGSHGTHVAAIAAGYHPEDPSMNGMAPGAQIVSLKIGDQRIDSLETGTGLMRAVNAMVEHKVHLANMSYGEPSAYPDFGRFIEHLRDTCVLKKQVIFVSSAGNEGPTISSVGTPGGTTSNVLSVGAYVTTAQIKSNYALMGDVPEGAYTWCSRGPAIDGYKGVDVYAPGSAITDIPPYLYSKFALMNGTSMSSPNCCGCLALILSGLQDEKRSWTPTKIRKAVINSAKDVRDTFRIGFLQVEALWDYILKFGDQDDQDAFFDIRCPTLNNARGIYLRERAETEKPLKYPVKIKPIFNFEDDTPKKINFESRLKLIPSANWIQAPDFLALYSEGREVNLKIDPTNLTPGKVYYEEILGINSQSGERGPVITIPITVCKPAIIDRKTSRTVTLRSGEIDRFFVHVPIGATYAEFSLKKTDERGISEEGGQVWVVSSQLGKQHRPQFHYKKYNFILGGTVATNGNDDQVQTRKFTVAPGKTMEICVAKYWNNPGTHSIEYQIKFDSFLVDNGMQALTLDGNNRVSRFDLCSAYRSIEQSSLSITFDTLQRSLRPTESRIGPLLHDRDLLPNGKLMSELVLQYTLKLHNFDTPLDIKPYLPVLKNYLYDSFIADVTIQVFDFNKKLEGFSSIYPKKISIKRKGDYLIRVQVKDESIERLEKLQNALLAVDITLSKTVSFPLFSNYVEAFSTKPKTKFNFRRNVPEPIFVSTPSELPKQINAGDVLKGCLKDDTLRLDGRKIPVTWIAPSIIVKSTNHGPEKPSTPPPKANIDQETYMKEAEIGWLKKLNTNEEKEQFFQQLYQKYPNDFAVLKARLEWYQQSQSDEEQVLKYADELIALIDETAMLSYFADKETNHDDDLELKSKMELHKAAIILASGQKCAALIKLIEKDEQMDEEKVKRFEDTYILLKKWKPQSQDFHHILLTVWKHRKDKLYATAWKLLDKWIHDATITKEKLNDINEAHDLRRKLLKDLNFEVWSDYEVRLALLARPVDFASF